MHCMEYTANSAMNVQSSEILPAQCFVYDLLRHAAARGGDQLDE